MPSLGVLGNDDRLLVGLRAERTSYQVHHAYHDVPRLTHRYNSTGALQLESATLYSMQYLVRSLWMV